MSIGTTIKIATSVLLGGGVCTVVGCYAGGLIKFGEAKGPVTLTENNTFESTYAANTVGGNFGEYLVGVRNPKNKSWGEKTYQQYKKEGLTELKSAGSADLKDKTALNYKCNELYKTYFSVGDIDFSYDIKQSFSSITDNEEKKAAFLVNYCSHKGKKLKEIAGPYKD